MPPSSFGPSDPVLLSQTSKTLTTQLQLLHSTFRLWDQYNSTLVQLASEYFNARQQLSLFSSTEYYLPSLLTTSTSSSNSKSATVIAALQAAARGSVINTLEMNEVYQLQQIITKINHCLSMLQNAAETIQFVSYEIQAKFNDFVNDQCGVILGEISDFGDLLKPNAITKVNKIKGFKSRRKITTSDVTSSENDYIDEDEEEDSDYEDDEDYDDDKNNDKNKKNKNKYEHYQVLPQIDFTTPSLHHPNVDQINVDLINNLPLITETGYSNWIELMINRHSEIELMEWDLDKKSYEKAPALLSIDKTNSTGTISSSDKTTPLVKRPNNKKNNNTKNKEIISSEDDESYEDEDDDNDTYEERHMHVDWQTLEVKHEPMMNPEQQVVVTSSFNLDERAILKPFTHNTTTITTPTTTPHPPIQLFLHHPNRYSNQFDSNSYYTISHIYSTILNQLETLTHSFLAELEQKVIIIKCIVAVNYEDVQYDIGQLSKGSVGVQIQQTRPLSLAVDVEDKNNKDKQENALLPPLIYSPPQPHHHPAASNTTQFPTNTTNTSDPIGIDHITNNMAVHLPKANEMKQYLHILELEPQISAPLRQGIIHHIDNIIRTQLALD